MWRRIILGIEMLFCILSMGIWSQAALADVPPTTQTAPVIGETRTYAPRFLTLHCTSWTLTALNQNGYAVSKCGGYTAYVLMTNGALVHITDADGNDALKFTPFQPSLNFPLTVGKTWTASYTGYLKFADSNWNGNISCKVAAYETIQVQAGSFPSFRILCHEDWASGPYSGSSDTTSWYAPQLHSLVKVDSPDAPKWDMELQSYTPH